MMRRYLSAMAIILLALVGEGLADMEMPPDRLVTFNSFQFTVPEGFAILDGSNEVIYTISNREQLIVINISFLECLGGKSLQNVAAYDIFFMQQDGYSLDKQTIIEEELFPQVETAILLYSKEIYPEYVQCWESVLFAHQAGQMVMLGISYPHSDEEWLRPEEVNSFMESLIPFPQGYLEHECQFGVVEH